MNIDQFATRDLSPAESRTLAQQALQNEELFDALVAKGAVEASLDLPALKRSPRRMPWVAGGLAAAAAILIAVFLWRGSSRPPVLPSLDAANGQPVLLASDLSPAHSTERARFSRRCCFRP